jgi:GDP-D-mannose 3',5'-epimerase
MDSLRKINGKYILITGGAGFIGSHLARFLTNNTNNILRVVGHEDLTNYENCLKITRDMDYVFHFANKMGGIKFVKDNGMDIMTNNILVNTNMIKASAENKVDKFFFPSSFCVYPENLQTEIANPLKEEDAIPANPDTYYGWEKLFTEKMLEAYRGKIKTRIARFVSIYGPGNHYKGGQEKVIPALCYKALKATDTIEIFGNGKQIRSFCYIDDCIDAIIEIMESDYDTPFNVDGPSAITVDDIANYAIKESGKSLIKKFIPTITGVNVRLANITKMKIVLDWQPKIDIEEGIKRTYKWIKNEENKCFVL